MLALVLLTKWCLQLFLTSIPTTSKSNFTSSTYTNFYPAIKSQSVLDGQSANTNRMPQPRSSYQERYGLNCRGFSTPILYIYIYSATLVWSSFAGKSTMAIYQWSLPLIIHIQPRGLGDLVFVSHLPSASTGHVGCCVICSLCHQEVWCLSSRAVRIARGLLLPWHLVPYTSLSLHFMHVFSPLNMLDIAIKLRLLRPLLLSFSTPFSSFWGFLSAVGWHLTKQTIFGWGSFVYG